MPVAPNKQELYKFETHIMSGSQIILNSAGLTSSYYQQGATNLASPRVEIQPVFGAPNGHVKLSASTATYDAWNAQLNVLVITDRTNNPSAHYDFTSKVIQLFSDYANWNSSSVLAYHRVARSDYQGSTPSVRTAENKDVSGLNFALSVWVKPDAWPNV